MLNKPYSFSLVGVSLINAEMVHILGMISISQNWRAKHITLRIKSRSSFFNKRKLFSANPCDTIVHPRL